ncbi:hypothetical protein SAMN04490206_2375 [Pseudomonas umsongensis]|nr:hypothetical protein SAMN04490206_2375 [Pseudomonas umsongensis]
MHSHAERGNDHVRGKLADVTQRGYWIVPTLRVERAIKKPTQKSAYLDRSHALRGNAARDAPRSADHA